MFVIFISEFIQKKLTLTIMIEIDGSYGEGGGQIVRTAVTLSAITGNIYIGIYHHYQLTTS